jgi:hypothetical protein
MGAGCRLKPINLRGQERVPRRAVTFSLKWVPFASRSCACQPKAFGSTQDPTRTARGNQVFIGIMSPRLCSLSAGKAANVDGLGEGSRKLGKAKRRGNGQQKILTESVEIGRARRDRAGALRYETINADLAPARAHPGCRCGTDGSREASRREVLIGVGNGGRANMQLPEINEP